MFLLRFTTVDGSKSRGTLCQLYIRFLSLNPTWCWMRVELSLICRWPFIPHSGHFTFKASHLAPVAGCKRETELSIFCTAVNGVSD